MARVEFKDNIFLIFRPKVFKTLGLLLLFIIINIAFLKNLGYNLFVQIVTFISYKERDL